MCDDLISREETLYELATSAVYYFGIEEDKAAHDWAMGVVSKMPSAQPEIIRCKDCKWWDKIEDSPFGYCMAMKHGYMTANWEIGIYRRYKGDFYCADAERRTDD